MKTTLEKPSTFFRSTVARGISAKDEKTIQRDGGKYKAGIIPGFAVISRGEALGHGMWIDGEMLSQVAVALNAAKSGLKARFTHPSLSGDGLGKMTAKAFSAEVDGDVVRADAHMLESAHDTPDGDLAGYVMDLAEEAPEDFGASISFRRDMQAEEDFMRTHGAVKRKNDDGYSYWDLSEFVSPDPKNTENLPHARLKSLRAVDFVDSPAANPSGLFHEGPFEMLENGEAILDFVFGVKDQAPESCFGIDATRLRGFAARWAGDRGFALQKGSEMPDPVLTPPASTEVAATELTAGAAAVVEKVDLAVGVAAAAAPAPTKPADKPAETPATFTAEQLAEKEKAAREGAKAELLAQQKKFVETFGSENGAKWFSEGITFEEGKDWHIAALTAQNKDLASKNLAATGGLGEQESLSGSAEGGKKLDSKYLLSCGPNLGRTAAAIDAQLARLQPSTN